MANLRQFGDNLVIDLDLIGAVYKYKTDNYQYLDIISHHGGIIISLGSKEPGYNEIWNYMADQCTESGNA